MPGEQLITRFTGLWRSTNPISSSPEGTMDVAENVVITDCLGDGTTGALTDAQ
jgi:hypothetical protein